MMATRAPDRLDELAAIESAIWRELDGAAREPDHPWRVAVLATLCGEGVDARSIVLREIDAQGRALVFFTDARSAKAGQIGACAEGVIVLWSRQLSWQLRLAVAMQIETSGLGVSSRWARLKMTPAAQDYLSPLRPGATLAAPDLHPRPDRSSREHFAVVTASVRRIDWLELHAQGHRRAIFDDAGARWVAP